jgi:RimJ/RimL family protein N-acetyltransferase
VAWNDEPQPTLRTRRLVLRPFRADEGPRVDELAGDRAIADTTANVPHPYPAGGGQAFIATHAPRWAAGEDAVFAMALAETDETIGVISLQVNPVGNLAVLGYWLGHAYWNNGYTTEAARAVIDFGFERMGLNRIEATYLMRNPASGRVMEKAGMTLEGVMRQAMRKWGVYEDVGMQSILRSDWEAARGAK